MFWGSTNWGESLNGSAAWRLSHDDERISLTMSGKLVDIPFDQLKQINFRAGMIWAALVFKRLNGPDIALDGIPNEQAEKMLNSVQAAKAAWKVAQRAQVVRKHLATLEGTLRPVLTWFDGCQQELHQHDEQKRWVTTELVQRWLKGRPKNAEIHELASIIKEPELVQHIAGQDVRIRHAIRWLFEDVAAEVAARNETHTTSELAACADFLDRVEKSPLTPEQARAVVCFDNRVQIIASAGSGKTSTMVAKAGYALHRRLVPADRILLLAFNADAAKELQQRIRDRLEPLGFPAEQIVARTFHAFGLDVIGQATGQRPTLAPWLERGGDIDRLSDIIDDLKDRDAPFRAKWDLFRMVFSRDIPKFGTVGDAEDWDQDSKKTGYRTLNGEVVKSLEERVIADWLFYNGVEYRYEPRYQFDTADPTHRQYYPDFYYPAAQAYHEHFALNAKGQPPKEFTGYLEGVKWKRGKHQEMGTTLWETTSATLWSGKAFALLTKKLKAAKVKLDPNPDRPARGRKVIEQRDLVKVFRVFLTHAKSNQRSDGELQARLQVEDATAFRHRHSLFLELFAVIREEWERRLAADGVIDFEDMLNLAAEHLEQKTWASPFELVMVDEFQDASRARARMARALVQQPDRFLCVVGDDWQSINRFAGADISVMTGFEGWFGAGQTLRLETTFRCPQAICDVSSAFVTQNPVQIKKVVRAHGQPAEAAPENRTPRTNTGSLMQQVRQTLAEEERVRTGRAAALGRSVAIYQVAEDNMISSAIEARLARLHIALANGSMRPGRNGRVDVFVLGRYRRDSEFVLPHWQRLFGDRINVSFMTVHGSKGLEADIVVVPRLVRGSYGFPSGIEDDPVLQLAMPAGDTFPHAEERRLFYVAMTRARRSVALFTVEHQMSEFATELVRDFGLRVTMLDVGGPATAAVNLCSVCQKGTMVPRTGVNGAFWGCNRWPACGATHN